MQYRSGLVGSLSKVCGMDAIGYVVAVLCRGPVSAIAGGNECSI